MSVYYSTLFMSKRLASHGLACREFLLLLLLLLELI